MESFIIRNLRIEDAEEIKEVALASWKYTYSDIFDEEEIRNFNESYYSISSLKRIAKNIESDLFKFLVMEDTRNDKIIGFAQIGYDKFFEGSENVKSNDINLFRIYLHPDYIGKGLGKKLLQKIETFVENSNKDWYFLFVHKNNQIGKRFYKKMGFDHISDLDHEDELYLRKYV